MERNMPGSRICKKIVSNFTHQQTIFHRKTEREKIGLILEFLAILTSDIFTGKSVIST